MTDDIHLQGHFTLNCCPVAGNLGVTPGRLIKGDLKGGRVVAVSDAAPAPLRAALMGRSLSGLMQMAADHCWRIEVSFEPIWTKWQGSQSVGYWIDEEPEVETRK